MGSWSFDLTEDDRTVAAVVVHGMRDQARIEVGRAHFTLSKEGVASPTFRFEFEGVELARARRTSGWKRAYAVNVSPDLLGRASTLRLTLRADGPFTQNFVVEEGGRRAGSIRRRGLFRRRSDVRIDDAIPLGVQAFLLALVVLDWRRAARRSAG